MFVSNDISLLHASIVLYHSNLQLSTLYQYHSDLNTLAINFTIPAPNHMISISLLYISLESDHFFHSLM